MDSLVLELQRRCLDTDAPILEVLHMALVVARKLGVPDFQQWLTHELNGYGPDVKVPGYRVATGQVKAWNPYQGWIPVIFNDAAVAEKLSEVEVRQPVGELQSLHEGDPSHLEIPFHPDLERQLMRASRAGLQPTLHISKTVPKRIVDAVRTIVLNWTMDLEQAEILGEGMTFSSKEKESASRANYEVNIYGPVSGSQIQQAASGSLQSIAFELNLEALQSFISEVRRRLDELGLESRARQQLKAELESAEAQLTAPSPNRSVLLECVKSVRSILEGCVGSVIASGLLHSLGNMLPKGHG